MSVMHLRLSNKRAQAVARLLGQDTAQRIMDCVSEESKPENQIAKELGMPLSTVHYNVQRLVEAGLVVSDEYTYSEKGKEVRHYKLASEHVLITTRPLAALPQALTGLGLSVVVAAGVWWTYAQQQSAKAVNAAPEISRMVADGAEEAMFQAAPLAASAASTPSAWPWILLGAGTMLLGILVAWLIMRYRA